MGCNTEALGLAKWYTIFQGLNAPSSSSASGFQPQSSYQSSTRTQCATALQSLSGCLTLRQGLPSGGYVSLLGQSIPLSSQFAVTTKQIAGFQHQILWLQSPVFLKLPKELCQCKARMHCLQPCEPRNYRTSFKRQTNALSAPSIFGISIYFKDIYKLYKYL